MRYDMRNAVKRDILIKRFLAQTYKYLKYKKHIQVV